MVRGDARGFCELETRGQQQGGDAHQQHVGRGARSVLPVYHWLLLRGTALLLADSSAAHPKKGAKFIPTSPSTHNGYSFVPLHPLQTTLKVYPRPNGEMYLCGLGGSDYVDPPRLKAGGDCDKPEVILPDPSRVTAATKSFKGMTSIGNEDPTVTQVCTPRVCGCS